LEAGFVFSFGSSTGAAFAFGFCTALGFAAAFGFGFDAAAGVTGTVSSL
jgi:hypothetical protein